VTSNATGRRSDVGKREGGVLVYGYFCGGGFAGKPGENVEVENSIAPTWSAMFRPVLFCELFVGCEEWSFGCVFVRWCEGNGCFFPALKCSICGSSLGELFMFEERGVVRNRHDGVVGMCLCGLRVRETQMRYGS
jgi:hypothetical protein